MQEERQIDRLARYIIYAAILGIAIIICRSCSTVLTYIVAAAVVSLIGGPLSRLLGRIKLGKKHLPLWLCSLVSVFIVLGTLIGIILLMTPVFSNIASDLAKADLTNTSSYFNESLKDINLYLRRNFPSLGNTFKIQNYVIEQLSSMLSVNTFSNLLTGVASFIASFGVAIFSIIFIAFFFIKDSSMFSHIVAAFVPDRLEKRVFESMEEIHSLLSRYFVGLILESTGITLLNFTWLMIFGRLGLLYSLGIAFITGILNIIPYVGPLIGEIMGTILAIVIRFVCLGTLGSMSPLGFAAMILALLFLTQLIDNFFFQPFIYSKGIKCHPLEVFIVLLLAGHFFGMIGMLAAIPAYTVIRTIAARFFSDIKVVRRLTGVGPDTKLE